MQTIQEEYYQALVVHDSVTNPSKISEKLDEGTSADGFSPAKVDKEGKLLGPAEVQLLKGAQSTELLIPGYSTSNLGGDDKKETQTFGETSPMKSHHQDVSRTPSTDEFRTKRATDVMK